MFNRQYLIFVILIVGVAVGTSYTYFATAEGNILLFHAERHFAEGRQDEGLQLLKAATSISQLKRPMLFRIAKLHTEQKQSPEAIAVYRQLLKLEPRDQVALRHILTLYREQGDREAALGLLSNFDDGDPVRLAFEDELLGLHLELGQFKEAAKILTLRIEACSEEIHCGDGASAKPTSDLRKQLARIHSWSQNFTEAILLYESLVEQSSEDLELRLEYAQVLTWHKSFFEAAEELREVLKQDAMHEHARRQLVAVLAWGGNHEEALRELTKIPGESLREDMTRLVADLHLKEQDFEGAENTYRTFLAVHPAAHDVRLSLAEVLSWQAKHEQAIVEYQQLVAVYPEDVQLRRNYAAVLSWAGKHNDAATELRKTLGSP